MVNLVSSALTGSYYDPGFGSYDYSLRSSAAVAVHELFASSWGGGSSFGILGYGGYTPVGRALFGSLFYPPFFGYSSIVLPYDFVNAAQNLMGWGNAVVNSYPWNAPHLVNAMMSGVTPNIPASTWPPQAPMVPVAPAFHQTLGHGGRAERAAEEAPQRVRSRAGTHEGDEGTEEGVNGEQRRGERRAEERRGAEAHSGHRSGETASRQELSVVTIQKANEDIKKLATPGYLNTFKRENKAGYLVATKPDFSGQLVVKELGGPIFAQFRGEKGEHQIIVGFMDRKKDIRLKNPLPQFPEPK